MRFSAVVIIGVSLSACGGATPGPSADEGGKQAGYVFELPPVAPGCGAGALAIFRARMTNAAVDDSWTDIVVRAQAAEAKAECESTVQRELSRSLPTDVEARATLVRGCALEPLPQLPVRPVEASRASLLVTPRDTSLQWLLASKSPHGCLTSMTIGLSRFYSREDCKRSLARIRAESGATPAEARSRAESVMAGHVTEIQARVYDLCQAAKGAKQRCDELMRKKNQLGRDCERERGAACERAVEATMSWRACEETRSPAHAVCEIETRRLQILRTRKQSPLDASAAHCRDE